MIAPFFERGGATLYVGDCREVMADMPECSVDAVVCDPPYEIGFMGRAWDRTGVAFRPEAWDAALRVLKPGGHLLAFGGTRTFHRVACAIEDAGFEVRDTLSWLYGTGFPKSLDVAKAIDATERFGGSGSKQLRARDGREVGTVGTNMGTHRSGRNDNAAHQWERDDEVGATWCRVCGSQKTTTPPAKCVAASVVSPTACRWQGWGTALKPAWEPIVLARKPLAGTVAANVQAHGTGAVNVDACRIGDRWPANVVLDEAAEAALDAQGNHSPGVGPSRFFYVAKASRAERDAGCESLPARTGGEATDREDGSAGLSNPRAGAGRTGGARNVHPTVKPVELMRWLVRLVTPPGGIVLDPFAGSGTTLVAARDEGFRAVGVEREAEYCEIAMHRIKHDAEAEARAEAEKLVDKRQTSFGW